MIPPASTPVPVTAPVRNKHKNSYMTRVMGQMLEDLKYPQAKDGSITDVNRFAHLIAWHLVRCGWRKPNNTDGFPLVEEFDDPIIKARKVLGGGVFEDAVVWVGFNEPDDPLEHLEDMTIREVEALPDEVKYEAKRRLGLLPRHEPTPPPEMSNASEWSVTPEVRITDAAEESGDDHTTREG